MSQEKDGDVGVRSWHEWHDGLVLLMTDEEREAHDERVRRYKKRVLRRYNSSWNRFKRWRDRRGKT